MSATMEVPQPMPSDAAKGGLFKISEVSVTFSKGVTNADEKAALAYLDEMIHWWNLPWRQWRSNRR